MPPVERIPDWPVIQSKIHVPGRWVLLTVGTIFLLAGLAGFTAPSIQVPPALLAWFPKLFFALLGTLGGLTLLLDILKHVPSRTIQHALPEMYPGLYPEPVLRPGAIVYGHMTHELSDQPDGWQYQPRYKIISSSQRCLTGFGILFLIVFAGLISWSQPFRAHFHWTLSVLLGVSITLVGGGTVLAIAWQIIQRTADDLCLLKVSSDEKHMELIVPASFRLTDADSFQDVVRVATDPSGRHCWKIPLKAVLGIQLCPWKYCMDSADGKTTTWAVQGLLVVSRNQAAPFLRIPILLTGDFVEAARLMEQLAEKLGVPFLFSGDAAAWKAEALRARKRPPVQGGGIL